MPSRTVRSPQRSLSTGITGEVRALFLLFVLAYGALMTFVLNSPRLMQIAEQRFPQPLVNQMNMHRGLGLICLFLGAAWSLQNLWFQGI